MFSLVFNCNMVVFIFNVGIDMVAFIDVGKFWWKCCSGVMFGFIYDINLFGLIFVIMLGVIEVNLCVNFNNEWKC